MTEVTALHSGRAEGGGEERLLTCCAAGSPEAASYRQSRIGAVA